MKKITLIALMYCSFTMLFAQVPQKMSYQSVIRKIDGTLVVNTLVGIKISILQGSLNGTAAYVETQTTTTNANGLATLAIGGGTPITGTLAGINWASGTYFIKTETDPIGGVNYTITGTSQLLSVPYALYAGSSHGKTSIVLTGNITDTQAASQIAAESGPFTENVYIQNTTGLTNVDLSAITSLMTLNIKGNANLNSVNLSGLSTSFQGIDIEYNPTLGMLSFPVYTTGSGQILIKNNSVLNTITFPILNKLLSSSEVHITDNTILNSISMPLLTTSSILDFENINLTSLSLSALTNASAITIAYNKLTSIVLPSLLTTGNLSFVGNMSLTSISTPSLISGGSISITNNPLLVSVNLPALTTSTNFNINYNSALTTIGIPLYNSFTSATNMSFIKNALPSSQVNALLNKMLNVMPVSGKSIWLQNQNPLAPPTGQGIVDKATLINAGNTVYTD